jgi:hypothetical protein
LDYCPYGDVRRKIVTGGDKIPQEYFDRWLTRHSYFLDWTESQLGNREKTMPVQPQEQETLNVKLVHFTKQNSSDEPVQLAFSVVDEQGKEEIITGEIPYSYDLFRLCQENGWLNIRRGVASIRESRTQRRAMSA